MTDLSFPNVTAERGDHPLGTGRRQRRRDRLPDLAQRVPIADTTNVEVAVRWFNDGSPEQVVQVRAVDAAGNQSSDAPARLVVRPLPAPATESSDASEPSTTPGSTGKPSADPSDGDSVE